MGPVKMIAKVLCWTHVVCTRRNVDCCLSSYQPVVVVVVADVVVAVVVVWE